MACNLSCRYCLDFLWAYSFHKLSSTLHWFCLCPLPEVYELVFGSLTGTVCQKNLLDTGGYHYTLRYIINYVFDLNSIECWLYTSLVVYERVISCDCVLPIMMVGKVKELLTSKFPFSLFTFNLWINISHNAWYGSFYCDLTQYGIDNLMSFEIWCEADIDFMQFHCMGWEQHTQYILKVLNVV